MDAPKNGESSRSAMDTDAAEPTLASGTGGAGAAPPAARAVPALILPDWDPLPPKHLHSSLDLISLLHLDGLYNSYVRPYFDPVPETDDEGGADGHGAAAGGRDKPVRPRKKQGLSKGYVGLLEDCIDPVPMGSQAEHSLLPLVGEWLDPPRPLGPDEIPEGTITLISADILASAKLEVGLKQDGYAGGEKLGVREAEERRRRKKQARLSQSVAPDLPDLALPSPTGGAPPTPIAPPNRGRGTPFTAPRRGGGPPGSGGGGSGRPPWPRASAPPGHGPGYRPNPAGVRPGTPGTPTPRGGPTPGTPGGGGTPLKRPGDGAYPAAVKRMRPHGGGSRSASPADVGVKAMFKGHRRTEEP
ncbi:uncharacterized protein LOC62_07G009185 [Vanrija pseudolonga]|uniref:Mediator of RNA polymerase II transcription subunit 19 n=1 Tax=Vanrija pseudolonga TaxID=143232 RepID=A0AAF0YKE9_9TREE|nr:hypothetical protein LOC62_07G009185 [Vanrija pseudolonga]